MIYSIFIIIASLILLIYSSELAVKKIKKILNHFGYSTTFGGLVIFSTVTSLPEIFSHITASIGILFDNLDYHIASATVLGANVGSDVIQQTLILGIVVLFMGSFVFKKKFIYTAYLPMIGTTLLTLILGWDRLLSHIDGLILIITFIIYVFYLWIEENHNKKSRRQKSKTLFSDIALSLFSFVLMLISASYLLKNTQELVLITGLGGSLIGVVTLGVASATPELFTAISGIRNKATGISLGTLIGSNITNPLIGIGIGSSISTYWTPLPLIYWDLPLETITALLLLIYLLFNNRTLKKGGAIYLIFLYLFYLVIRFLVFSVD